MYHIIIVEIVKRIKDPTIYHMFLSSMHTYYYIINYCLVARYNSILVAIIFLTYYCSQYSSCYGLYRNKRVVKLITSRLTSDVTFSFTLIKCM